MAFGYLLGFSILYALLSICVSYQISATLQHGCVGSYMPMKTGYFYSSSKYSIFDDYATTKWISINMLQKKRSQSLRVHMNAKEMNDVPSSVLPKTSRIKSDTPDKGMLKSKDTISTLSVNKAIELLDDQGLTAAKASLYIEGILIQSGKVSVSSKTWRKLLDACINFQFVSYSIEVFQKAIQSQIVITPQQLSKLLTLLCSSGNYDESIAVMNEAAAVGYDITIQDFSKLMKYCRSPKEAFEMLMKMESLFGFKPNVISYTSAIKCCENANDLKSALMLLDLMKINDIKPNEVTFSCIISVAAKTFAGYVGFLSSTKRNKITIVFLGQVAISALREMQSCGFPPNQLCFSGALFACARSGMWAEVEFLFMQMERFKMPLEESVLISIIGACRGKETDGPEDVQWRKSIWLLDNYLNKTVNPTHSLFTMCMSVCEKAEQYKEILKLQDKMIQHGLKPTKSSIHYLVKAYLSLGHVDKVMELMYNSKKLNIVTISSYRLAVQALQDRNRTLQSIELLIDYLHMTYGRKRNDSSMSILPDDKQLICSYFETLVNYKMTHDAKRHRRLKNSLVGLFKQLHLLFGNNSNPSENHVLNRIIERLPQHLVHEGILVAIRTDSNYGLKLVESIMNGTSSLLPTASISMSIFSSFYLKEFSRETAKLDLTTNITLLAIKHIESIARLQNKLSPELSNRLREKIMFNARSAEGKVLTLEDMIIPAQSCLLAKELFQFLENIYRTSTQRIGLQVFNAVGSVYHRYNYTDGMISLYEKSKLAYNTNYFLALKTIEILENLPDYCGYVLDIYHSIADDKTILRPQHYRIVLQACKHSNRWDLAEDIFHNMTSKSTVHVTTAVFNSFMRASLDANRPDVALKVFEYVSNTSYSEKLSDDAYETALMSTILLDMHWEYSYKIFMRARLKQERKRAIENRKKLKNDPSLSKLDLSATKRDRNMKQQGHVSASIVRIYKLMIAIFEQKNCTSLQFTYYQEAIDLGLFSSPIVSNRNDINLALEDHAIPMITPAIELLLTEFKKNPKIFLDEDNEYKKLTITVSKDVDSRRIQTYLYNRINRPFRSFVSSNGNIIILGKDLKVLIDCFGEVV